MPFTVPSYDAIRNAILRDIRNQLPDAAVGSDSDNFVRAAGVGAAIEGVYQHQAWLYRQIWPDTADPDELEHHAANRGLKLKPAVAAVGSVTLTGTKGLWLAPGQALRHNASGAGLVTTASVTLGDGPTAVSVVALESGAAANGLQGAGTLTSPPLGVDSGARLATLTGGVDAETHAELLARLLDLMQHPPAGGTVHDYRRWALAVPGVTLVIVLPRRRGVGTVDLVITSADGLPSEDTLDAVRNHLDNVGPVGADWQVHAPQLLNVDLRAQFASPAATPSTTCAGVPASKWPRCSAGYCRAIPSTARRPRPCCPTWPAYLTAGCSSRKRMSPARPAALPGCAWARSPWRRCRDHRRAAAPTVAARCLRPEWPPCRCRDRCRSPADRGRHRQLRSRADGPAP
ncbi:baseplate J/gp47 family protein [Pseudomonas aeruginosa]|nr:baseplate J/gp47 family protein [Pseudomonas aeruginosa]